MGAGDGSIITLSHVFTLMLQKRKSKRVSSSGDCMSTGTAGAAAAAPADGAAAAAGEVGELVELAPGGSVVVPLWVHATHPGQLEFSCVWFCEAAVSSGIVILQFMIC